MNTILSIVLTFLLFTRTESQEITLAITNCNVITMVSSTVLKHQTILISNDRIYKILPASQWVNNSSTPVIDGTGKYIIPSLSEMHIHVNQYSNWMFPMLLSYGVTTIRVMAGNEAVLKWRDSIKNNLKMAPDIHVASQVIDGNPPYWGKLHEGPVISDADSAELIIADQLTKGYEFIKVYNRLNPAVYKKIRSICFEKNIKLTGHVPVQLDRADILSRQTCEIEHLSGYIMIASNVDTVSAAGITKYSDLAYGMEMSRNYSLNKIKTAAAKTKEFEIWNCPTLIGDGIKTDSMFCKNLPNGSLASKLTPVLSWWVSQGYSMTPDEKNLWTFKKTLVKELNRNKAALLAGTDCPLPWTVPGLSLHQELKYMVQAGLTNYEALKTATVNPAAWYGKDYDKGTIESGKRADLIILNDNPLTDITNTQKIVLVIFKGKPFQRDNY
jgi:adenine deaminase